MMQEFSIAKGDSIVISTLHKLFGAIFSVEKYQQTGFYQRIRNDGRTPAPGAGGTVEFGCQPAFAL